MIYKLLNRFYQFGCAEYWRARCLAAEAQLDAEVWRNRSREDEMITVPMRSMGMFGMPPRSAPASVVRLAAAPPVRSIDPFNDLGPVDRMEFETNWLPDARAHNIPEAQAKQQFLMAVAKRKTLNDEPYSM